MAPLNKLQPWRFKKQKIYGTRARSEFGKEPIDRRILAELSTMSLANCSIATVTKLIADKLGTTNYSFIEERMRAGRNAKKIVFGADSPNQRTHRKREIEVGISDFIKAHKENKSKSITDMSRKFRDTHNCSDLLFREVLLEQFVSGKLKPEDVISGKIALARIHASLDNLKQNK